MKSSGRDSLAFWPVEVVISSPLAKRYASTGPRRQPKAPAVHRERCVQMRVAEERTRGKIAARVRRVRRLGGKHLRGRFLVECADVGRDRSCAKAGRTSVATVNARKIRFVFMAISFVGDVVLTLL
jgi:hypothetical protein